MQNSIRFCQHDHFIYFSDGSYSQQCIVGFCTNLQCQTKLACDKCIEIFHYDHKEKILRYKDLQLVILKNFSDNAYQLKNDRVYFNEQKELFKQYKEQIFSVIENFENEFTNVCNKVYQMIDFYVLADQVRNENWAEITEQSLNNHTIKLLTQNQQKILSNYQTYNVQVLRYRDKISKIEQQIKCALEEIDYSPFLKQWITLKELLFFYENNQLDYLDAPIDCANIKGIVISNISNENEQYYGELNEKNQRNGKGTQTIQLGMQIQVKGQIIYEGIWNQNQLVWGQKTSYSESGECIILRGKMHEKKLQGEGMKISSFGDKYEGTFQNDIMEGKGTLINRNGDMYVGGFCDGKMNGKGVIKSEVNGKQIWKYEGFFKNNVKQGDGTFYYPNGDIYCGQFQKDQPHGKGEIKYFNGVKFSGNFKCGQKEGEGISIQMNGDKYEYIICREVGTYGRNMKQGQFRLFRANQSHVYKVKHYHDDMEVK